MDFHTFLRKEIDCLKTQCDAIATRTLLTFGGWAWETTYLYLSNRRTIWRTSNPLIIWNQQHNKRKHKSTPMPNVDFPCFVRCFLTNMLAHGSPALACCLVTSCASSSTRWNLLKCWSSAFQQVPTRPWAPMATKATLNIWQPVWMQD